MTAQEFRDRYDKGELCGEDSIGDCAICNKPITDIHHDEEPRTFQGKPVHEDCYFAKLGEAIEQQPYSTPRVRRG